MLTKQVFVLLAMQGELWAARIFPHPYHYRVVTGADEPVEITADDVALLLSAKRIQAPHVSEWGDTYRYRVVDPVFVKDQALKGYVAGFGTCEKCGAVPVGITSDGKAVRHGHTKDTPPCTGSGQPVRRKVVREYD